MGHPLTCIGIPKTVDNDLMFTDCAPALDQLLNTCVLAHWKHH